MEREQFPVPPKARQTVLRKQRGAGLRQQYHSDDRVARALDLLPRHHPDLPPAESLPEPALWQEPLYLIYW